MLVSTTVESTLSLRPRVTFSERANSTARSLSAATVSRAYLVRPTDEGGVVGDGAPGRAGRTASSTMESETKCSVCS